MIPVVILENKEIYCLYLIKKNIEEIWCSLLASYNLKKSPHYSNGKIYKENSQHKKPYVTIFTSPI